MADYDSSLPIRSEADGTDERVHVKLVDYTDPSGVGNQAQISEGKVHVRNHGIDPAGDDVEVLLSEQGHTQSNGDYDAATNTRPSSQGLIASDRDPAPSESTMNLRPTAVPGESDKVALDVALSHSDGDDITEDNPFPVYLTDDPGTEVENYSAASAVAAAATANHDYLTLAEFRSLNVLCSASGKAKFSLQIETAPLSGLYNTIAVQFNSTANPNCFFQLKKPKPVVLGARIRVAKTNLDNQAQDLYSTINGVEVA